MTSIEEAVDAGWGILERCRQLERPVRVADDTWHPLSVGRGDVGAALTYSVADALDPEGGWDDVAHRHLVEAVRFYTKHPHPSIGLFGGVASLAWCLRSLSRGGQRYSTATSDVDRHLLQAMERSLDHLSTETSGIRVADYDVVSGVAGAMTYAMRWSVAELAAVVADSAVLLAERVIFERGFWVENANLTDFDREYRSFLSKGYRDLGEAHGAAGVLHVLAQAADRRIGGALVRDAVAQLGGELLRRAEASEYGLPFLEMDDMAVGTHEAVQVSDSRHAWCYGNLGLALSFAHSHTLRVAHPGALRRLLPPSRPRRGVVDGSLCHGWAGILILERHLLGDDCFDEVLPELMAFVNPAENLGIQELERGIPVPGTPGFMEQAGGMGAALVSIGADADELPSALEMFTGRWA